MKTKKTLLTVPVLLLTLLLTAEAFLNPDPAFDSSLEAEHRNFPVNLTSQNEYLLTYPIMDSYASNAQSSIFESDFEEGDLSEWDSEEGTPSVQSTIKYQGTYAMKCDGTDGDYVYNDYDPGYQTLIVRFYARFDNLPSVNGIHLLSINDFSSVNDYHLLLWNDGGTAKWALLRPPWWDEYLVFAAAGNPSIDTWYCVEVECARSGTTISAEVWIDGVSRITDNYVSGDSSDFEQVHLGGWGKSVSVTNYVDCVVVATEIVGMDMIAAISPLDVSMYIGQSQMFGSSVTGGTPPYVYQWYLNDEAVLNATSSSWMFTPTSTGNFEVYLSVTDSLNIQAQSNVVTNISVYSMHLLLTVDPNQALHTRQQSLTLTVNVFNQLNPPLETTLTLTITGPNNYNHLNLQRISIAANTVDQYSFSWDIPDVAGTYVVEVTLIQPILTSYDAVWLITE